MLNLPLHIVYMVKKHITYIEVENYLNLAGIRVLGYKFLVAAQLLFSKVYNLGVNAKKLKIIEEMRKNE